jgi:hypothetical protein
MGILDVGDKLAIYISKPIISVLDWQFIYRRSSSSTIVRVSIALANGCEIGKKARSTFYPYIHDR